MLADPAEIPVAKPALLIEATPAAEEFQFATRLSGSVEPSLKLPVAVNFCVIPGASWMFAGEIAIDCKLALLTVRLVLPPTVPKLAPIIVEPAALLVAKPLAEPTVATPWLEEFQDTPGVV